MGGLKCNNSKIECQKSIGVEEKSMEWEIVEKDKITHVRKFRDQFAKKFVPCIHMDLQALHTQGHEKNYLKPNLLYCVYSRFEFRFIILFLILLICNRLTPYIYHKSSKTYGELCIIILRA